jgi:hypothetical protein
MCETILSSEEEDSTVSTACNSGSDRWHRSIASSSSSSSSCSRDDPPIAAGTAGQFECRQARKKVSFCCIVFCAKKTITLFLCIQTSNWFCSGGKKKKKKLSTS